MISFWYGCKKYDILKTHMRKKQIRKKSAESLLMIPKRNDKE